MLKGVQLGLTIELETTSGYSYSTETTDTKEKTITKTGTLPASVMTASWYYGISPK